MAAQFSLPDLKPETWHQLLELLGLRGIIYNIALHCELRKITGNDLQLVLDGEHSALFNEKHSEQLRLALENYFGNPVSVSIEPGELSGETPAMRLAHLAEVRQAEAVVAIESDPQLQELIIRFDGELDRSSIHPTDV